MKITSIKKIESQEKRYDIETRKNHNFYANGMLVHNSSCSVYYNEGEFGVCSRNTDLKDVEGNTFWNVARELDLEASLRAFGRNIILQGELIGPGVQGNIYKLTKHEFRLFDIFDIDKQEYLASEQRRYLAGDLLHAPVIAHHANLKDTLGLTSMEDVLKFAEGKSQLADVHREGLVFKCIEDPNISFKAISNLYLCNQKD